MTKYPKYLGMTESTKGARKYPIIYFNSPTRPEPDPLPVFFYFEYLSRPDIEKPYSLGTVVIPFSFYLSRS